MSEINELARLAREAGIHDDPSIQVLLNSADTTPNERTQKLLERTARKRILRELDYPFQEDTPSVATYDPKIYIGETWRQRKPYYLPLNQLTQHLLTIGLTGTGKTTFHYNLVNQLPVPYWVFDLKQDYRHLIQHDEELLILPHEKLRFNPLQPPPGVRPRRWSTVFSEVFCENHALLEGSAGYLTNHLQRLYRKSENPDLPRLLNEIGQISTSHALPTAKYHDRIRNRIITLLNDTESTLYTEQSHPLPNLLKRNVVFELDGLRTTTQNFLMEIMLAWIYEYRKAQNHRGSELRHVNIIDESKTLFSRYKEQQHESGLPIIDKITARMREFGEGLVAADQEASKLTDSIKANTKTKVLLATGDHKEFQAITESMKFSDLQKEWAKTLDTGQGLIQHGDTEPLPIRLEDYELEKSVSDKELEQEMKVKWAQLPYTESTNTRKKSSSNAQESLNSWS